MVVSQKIRLMERWESLTLAPHIFMATSIVPKAQHTQTPRVITVDKNAPYPSAIEVLKEDETIAEETELRQRNYLNNIIEQNHRNINESP